MTARRKEEGLREDDNSGDLVLDPPFSGSWWPFFLLYIARPEPGIVDVSPTDECHAEETRDMSRIYNPNMTSVRDAGDPAR
eukprot:1332091-Amorphochlora_amoeboformis.AAC.1